MRLSEYHLAEWLVHRDFGWQALAAAAMLAAPAEQAAKLREALPDVWAEFDQRTLRYQGVLLSDFGEPGRGYAGPGAAPLFGPADFHDDGEPIPFLPS